MKKGIIIILLINLTSCVGQNKSDKDVIVKSNTKEIKTQNKSKIPKEGTSTINIGFNDNPVWVWAKFDHYLKLNDITFKHIFGINYWDENGSVTTMYYEKDRENKSNDQIDFSDYILKSYPGDKTLKLIGKKGDTILLFNVLENKDFRRKFKEQLFKRIPTVKTNSKNEKVSDYEIEVSITLKRDNIYEVTIINADGINKSVFKANCLADFEQISYYDTSNEKIYLINKENYLEKIK
jgi:hypothetical protein